jgi:hypothetical protein
MAGLRGRTPASGDAEVRDLRLARASRRMFAQGRDGRAARVDLLEAARQLEGDEAHDARVEASHLREHARHVLPVHVLLRDEALPAPGEAVVDDHHVRVVHPGGGLGLAGEALLVGLVLGEVAAQFFNTTRRRGRLEREVHDSHAALGQLLLDLVARDLPSGRIARHGSGSYASGTE